MPEIVRMLAAGATGESPYVIDLLIVLGAAAAVSVLSRRLRLAAIPGYLMVGALIGPSALRLIDSDANIQDIANLAIVLLMFTIGLHLDLDSIRSGMVHILGVGVVSTVAVVLVGWPIGMAFGLKSPAALCVAMALAMSSTAVVLGILQQRREVKRVHGRLSVGVLLVQDLLVVGVLAILPAVAIWAGVEVKPGEAAQELIPMGDLSPAARRLTRAALALGGIGLMLAGGKYIMPRVLREVTRGSQAGSAEALLVISAAGALAAAVLTTLLGFGPALGAFLAGFMLAGTPFRHQLAGQLSPMRDLFLAVFFTAIGIKMDLGTVVQLWWVIGMGVVLLIAVKAAIIGVTTWAGGATAAVAALTGFSLAQAGEFSLVVLDEASEAGIVTAQTQAAVIAMVVISLILTDGLVAAGRRVGERLSIIPPAKWIRSRALREPAEDVHAGGRAETTGGNHIIIAGFGVVGRNLAEHFASRRVPFTIVELNPTTVRRQQALGRRIVFGDASNPDVLESAGIRSAWAVILTIPDDEATLRACRAVRSAAPEVFIAARTSYLSRAIAATQEGADHVTVEEIATANDMARQVMHELEKRGLKKASASTGEEATVTPSST